MKKTFYLFFIISFTLISKITYADTCMNSDNSHGPFTESEKYMNGTPFERKALLPVFLRAIWIDGQGLTCQYKTNQGKVITLQENVIYKKESLVGSWPSRWECASSSIHCECTPLNGNVNDCPINY